MHVGKNMVDVLLDEGSRVNAIMNGLKQRLRLPPPPLPWCVTSSIQPRNGYFSFSKLLGIIPNIRIIIHGIPYIVNYLHNHE
jgi:hypothetical protein